MASYGNNGQYLDYRRGINSQLQGLQLSKVILLVLRVLAIGGGRHAGFLILAGYALYERVVT